MIEPIYVPYGNVGDVDIDQHIELCEKVNEIVEYLNKKEERKKTKRELLAELKDTEKYR